MSAYDHLSREELIERLKRIQQQPKLGLVWERDEIEHDHALNNDFVVADLEPALSHGDGLYEHLLIEADNFDALRYLRMTHAGKIRCIYIDPPLQHRRPRLRLQQPLHQRGRSVPALDLA